MSDVSQYIKAQIVNRLENTAQLIAVIPADRIFPMEVKALPAVPFVRYGYPNIRPYNDSCSEGSEVDIRLHILALGEDQVQSLAKIVVDAIDQHPDFFVCEWVRTQLFPDANEANVWQAVIDFYVVTEA